MVNIVEVILITKITLPTKLINLIIITKTI